MTTGPEYIKSRRTAKVLGEVAAERTRQDEKWGVQRLQDNDGTDDGRSLLGRPYAQLEQLLKIRCDRLRDEWRAGQGDPRNMTVAFLEEVFEALAQAVAGNPVELRAELVQVTALGCKWIEIIDWRAEQERVATADSLPLQARRAAGNRPTTAYGPAGVGPAVRQFKKIKEVPLPESEEEFLVRLEAAGYCRDGSCGTCGACTLRRDENA